MERINRRADTDKSAIILKPSRERLRNRIGPAFFKKSFGNRTARVVQVQSAKQGGRIPTDVPKKIGREEKHSSRVCCRGLARRREEYL